MKRHLFPSKPVSDHDGSSIKRWQIGLLIFYHVSTDKHVDPWKSNLATKSWDIRIATKRMQRNLWQHKSSTIAGKSSSESALCFEHHNGRKDIGRVPRWFWGWENNLVIWGLLHHWTISGPLQHKTKFNQEDIYYIVGVTSFGASCGSDIPGNWPKVVESHQIIPSYRFQACTPESRSISIG